jgi:hypothetical protein
MLEEHLAAVATAIETGLPLGVGDQTVEPDSVGWGDQRTDVRDRFVGGEISARVGGTL